MLNTLTLKLKLIFGILIFLTLLVAVINVSKSQQQNNAKLPTGLETKHKFLKWIDKWKDRFPQLEADSFKMVDDGEIISSTNPRYTFSSANLDVVNAEVLKFKDDKFKVIAPDKLQYLDFKSNFNKDGSPLTSYVKYYGIRENRLLTGPIYECKKTKCWYDRPFFEGPDLFYLPEIQEKINKLQPEKCAKENICSYEVLLHEFDLKANKRTTYASTQLLTDFKRVQEALEDL